jgi:hypothetical protein
MILEKLLIIFKNLLTFLQELLAILGTPRVQRIFGGVAEDPHTAGV